MGNRSTLCAECRHPKGTHHPRCIATVYTSGPGGNGMTAKPFQCKRFVPAENPRVAK